MSAWDQNKGIYGPYPYPPDKSGYWATGWACPKCGSVYSPSVWQCWQCSPPPKVSSGSAP